MKVRVLPSRSGQVFEVFAVEAVEAPVVQVFCAEAFVEVDGVGVPVEDRPLVAPAAAPYRLLSAVLEEGIANALAAELFKHEQVFEVEGRQCAEGRVCLKDERIADNPSLYFGKKNLEAGLWAKGILCQPL